MENISGSAFCFNGSTTKKSNEIFGLNQASAAVDCRPFTTRNYELVRLVLRGLSIFEQWRVAKNISYAVESGLVTEAQMCEQLRGQLFARGIQYDGETSVSGVNAGWRPQIVDVFGDAR